MVCIYTQMTRDDALSRLRDLLGGKEVSGNATGAQITLIRTQRYGNSVLRPAFIASLESTERGCLIRGQFGLLKSVRWFMIAWFLLAAIWIACTSVSSSRLDGCCQWPCCWCHCLESCFWGSLAFIIALTGSGLLTLSRKRFVGWKIK